MQEWQESTIGEVLIEKVLLLIEIFAALKGCKKNEE